MIGIFRNRHAGVLVYALMAALFVGLAGFGIGVGRSISSQDVARVGGRPVEASEYSRAMQQELQALTRQLGRDLPMTEARQYGVDRMVLARLVNDAALDEEAARLGISTGDAEVRDQVMKTPAFQGPDGKFDRATYTDAVGRIGLTTGGFESLLRREATRNLLSGSVQAAANLPQSEALAILAFLGEKRGFDWLRLDAGLLPTPIPAPTDAELEAAHQAHAADRYTRPETREISYASITPAALAATIDIPEADLRAAYDAAIDSYKTPERRAIDRIGFPTAAEAAAAKARIDAGETDFDAVATERGMKPGETDQGIVASDTLPPEVRTATEPGLIGPVETPLGPALYRLNAIMAAKTTPFDEAKAKLAQDRALEEAKKRIADDTAHIEDLIAGGATLEEIASETELQLGSIALNSESKGGLADDPKFRDAAAKAETGVETDLVELSGGGLVTLRVDKIDPPAVIPLAEIRDRVAADWTADQTAEALQKLATGYIGELKGGLAFADLAGRLNRPVTKAAPLTRGETAPGTPPELVADVFAAAPGAAITRRDGDGVILAQLTAIEPFDPKADANARVLANIESQYRQQVRDDTLALYTAAVRDEAGVTLNQTVIDSTLERFP